MMPENYEKKEFSLRYVTRLLMLASVWLTVAGVTNWLGGADTAARYTTAAAAIALALAICTPDSSNP